MNPPTLMTPKSTYNRRSDEERIADLQSKIAELQRKLVEQQRIDTPVLRKAEKIAKPLRELALVAAQHGRDDVRNSTLAFLAGLSRMLDTPPEPRRRTKRDEETEG